MSSRRRIHSLRSGCSSPAGKGGRMVTEDRRRWLIFSVVGAGLLMAAIDQTIVATALSTLQRDLHIGVQWSGWMITVYSLGEVMVMPLAGKISDMYGRRRIFLLAVTVFTISSLLCGLSVNAYMLIAMRALQAVGGGALMPSANGIVSDCFGTHRDRAIGMFTTIFSVGAVVGPVLGGLFVTYWSWRGIFLVNVPIGVVLLVAGSAVIPPGRKKPAETVDAVGAVLPGVLIISSMLGITSLGSAGGSVRSVQFVLSEAIAAVGLVLFLWNSRRAASPFISSALLYGRGIGIMNLINFLFGGAALGLGTLFPLYAQERFGISLAVAGDLLTARAVGTICVAALAVFALRRTGYRLPMLVGFGVIAAGLAMMAVPSPPMDPSTWIALAAGLAGVGMGLSIPASNNAILQLAPARVAGIAGLRG